MNLASWFPYAWWLLAFVGVLVLVTFAARWTAPRRFADTLNNLAMFLRPLDVVELAALLDPMVPLSLRQSLSEQDYRHELEIHIRLVREYLKRVNHNVHVIQSWVAGEYATIAGKNSAQYTEQDRLVVEGLRTATKLRRCVLAVSLKLWIWEVLRMDQWPIRFQPSIPNLRVIYGINLLVSYRRLAEITRSLAVERGGSHRAAILEVLGGF